MSAFSRNICKETISILPSHRIFKIYFNHHSLHDLTKFFYNNHLYSSNFQCFHFSGFLHTAQLTSHYHPSFILVEIVVIMPLMLFKEPWTVLKSFFPRVFSTETSSLVLLFREFYSCEAFFFFPDPPFWHYMILAISVEFLHILNNRITPERKNFWDRVCTLP